MKRIRLLDKMAEDFAKDFLSLTPSQDEWEKVIQAYQTGYRDALETVTQALMVSLSRQQLPYHKRWALRETILKMGESKIERKKNEQVHNRTGSRNHQNLSRSSQEAFKNESPQTSMEKQK